MRFGSFAAYVKRLTYFCGLTTPQAFCLTVDVDTMTYRVEQTKQGRFALISGDGVTVHVYHSEHAAKTSADAMNRANYEPTDSAYKFAESGCGRWDRQVGK